MSTPERSGALSQLQARLHDPSRRILLAGGTVVSMDEKIGEPVADLLIVGDHIEEIGPGLADRAGPDTLVVDVSGSVLLPGFVDSHMHAWEGAMRGVAPDADMDSYMAIANGAVARLMTAEDIAAGERVAATQALNGGITTIVDNSHNTRSPEHSDAAIGALRDAGIRAVHAVGPPVDGSDSPHLPDDLFRLRDEYFSSSDQLLTLRIFDIVSTPEAWRWANDNQFGIVSEFGMWVKGIDELFASGALGPDYTFNHCTGLTPDQWKAIADSGAAVNMVPRSDSHFGIGAFVPVLEANIAGVQEGISCDNELSYGCDMFTEMRTLLTVQRGLVGQAQFMGTPVVPARYGVRDVLRAATVGGARNAGLAGRIGALAPGMKADLVLLDMNQVALRPIGSTLGAVVNFAGIGDVEAVFVDGIVRKWAHRLVGVDHDAVTTAAENSRDRLLSELGTSIEQVRAGTNIRVN